MAAPPRPGPRIPGLLQTLVFVSGAAALVYQSVWTRQLSLVLGSTNYAVGTVLAAFMAGLGVGAFLIGGAADRVRRPLRVYAGLEAGIALAGLVSPLALGQGNEAYAWFYRRLHDAPGLLTLARFAIGFGFVVVPALLMGGTMPVATRHLVSAGQGVGRAVSRLYALNTLGAACGALALPYAMLPLFGLRGTLVATAVANLAIAAAAWRAGGAAAAPAPAAARAAAPPDEPAPGPQARLLVAFFVSGFVALGLEVVWNRFFAMYVGSSIYSYAMVLALYLCGIVAGGLVCERLVAAGRDPERLAAGAFVAVVAALAITVPVMDRVLIPQLVLLDALGLGFATFQVASAAAVALVVLPPTLAFGVSFPAVAAAIARQPRHAGRATGLVYLVNSAGTTAGSVVVSFLLMPALGVRGGLAALTGAMAAAALLAARGVRRPAALAAVVVALAAVPAVTPAWDLRRMHMAVNNDAAMVLNAWRNGLLQLALDGVEVLDLRDGVDATVSVARYADGEHALLVNGKGDASDGIDMFTQLVLGHLPLAVWPEARDVLVVGMGSGVTMGAVLRHPVARVDLVEISPEVIELGGRYFRGVNRAALDDPRVAVHVEDGRNFIAFGTGQYDLVVSEPSNPWMTGVANLFTGEFFGQVRARLRPGGALVQWFHQYGMALDDVRALLATLRRHFAHVYVFAFHHDLDIAGDLVMLATDAPLDFSRALAAFGGGPVAEDLRRFGVGEPAALAHGFVLGPGTLERFVDGAALNTDDHPRIELNAPRNVLRDTAFDNFEAVLAASHGAVLPAADAGSLVPRLARGPAGLREVSAGVRIVVSDGRTPTGFRARHLASDARWEDGAGAELQVVGVSGVRDATGLADLASRLLATRVTPAGAATVGGHRALRFGAPGGEALVGWTCERRGASFVAVGPGAATADVACHE